MKRKARKKMTLSKETLRTLEERKLLDVAGASHNFSHCFPSECRTCDPDCTVTCRPCSP